MKRLAPLIAAARRWAVRNLTEGEETPLVPPSGVVARLVVLAAAGMSFLAVCAAGFALTANRMADTWAAEVSGGATVRVDAPADQIAQQVDRVLAALRSTPGVAGARALSDAEHQALLAPWLGPDAPLEALEAPRIIAVEIDGAGPDAVDLSRRLAVEAPGALYDDHGRLRLPLARAARALTWLALAAVGLTLISAVAMVTLASRAVLATNRSVIELMRILGGTEAFIRRAFVRRLTLRAGAGSVLGAAAGVAALSLLPRLGAEGALIASLAPTGAAWVWLVLIPAVTALSAWAATRVSVSLALRRIG